MRIFRWGTHRRINTASGYLRRTFGSRMQKVSIDAGFTCPNRDGTKGWGGCSYCNNDAFNPSYCTPEKSIARQIDEGIIFHENRYRRAAQYLAYFQAYSNTYAPLEKLKELFEEALQTKKIAGLIIGTRPDCIDREKLEYFASLADKYYLVVEYGIESVNNNTLRRINRGHTFEESVAALNLTREYGIKSGAHFIFGLPGETREEMLNSVDTVSELPLHSVKFHQLQIIRGTAFADEYLENKDAFQLFTLDEYVSFIAEYISRLNPSIIIERLASETQPRNCVSDYLGIRYDQVLSRVEKYMEELDYWQGKFYKGKDGTM